MSDYSPIEISSESTSIDLSPINKTDFKKEFAPLAVKQTDCTPAIERSGSSGFMNSRLIKNYDLCMLGITIVIGGQYFGWNKALSMGFGSFLIAYILISFSYLSLTLSLAELASCVPFGGIISDLTCFLRLTEPYLSFLM